MQKLFLIAIAALALGCAVHRKTDGFECATTNDCNNGRVCMQGWCVGTNCPAVCTGMCDATTVPPTCIVDGSGGADITCPPGFQCMVTCDNPGACGDIRCASGEPCTISCTATSACGTISCSNACACDVTCASGDCGTNQCPQRTGKHCTLDGTTSTTCSSTAQSGCNICP